MRCLSSVTNRFLVVTFRLSHGPRLVLFCSVTHVFFFFKSVYLFDLVYLHISKVSNSMINRLVELEPGQRCDQGVEVEEEQWLSYLQALVSVQQCLLPQQSQIKVLRLIFMRFSRKICAELYERTILDLDKTSAPIGALEV